MPFRLVTLGKWPETAHNVVHGPTEWGEQGLGLTPMVLCCVFEISPSDVLMGDVM
jgi:hypothetical protein